MASRTAARRHPTAKARSPCGRAVSMPRETTAKAVLTALGRQNQDDAGRSSRQCRSLRAPRAKTGWGVCFLLKQAARAAVSWPLAPGIEGNPPICPRGRAAGRGPTDGSRPIRPADHPFDGGCPPGGAPCGRFGHPSCCGIFIGTLNECWFFRDRRCATRGMCRDASSGAGCHLECVIVARSAVLVPLSRRPPHRIDNQRFLIHRQI